MVGAGITSEKMLTGYKSGGFLQSALGTPSSNQPAATLILTPTFPEENIYVLMHH